MKSEKDKIIERIREKAFWLAWYYELNNKLYLRKRKKEPDRYFRHIRI